MFLCQVCECHIVRVVWFILEDTKEVTENLKVVKGLKCMQCKKYPCIFFSMSTLCPVHLFLCCPDRFLAPWCRLLAQDLHKRTQNVSGQFQHVFDHYEDTSWMTHLGWANRHHPKEKKKQAVVLLVLPAIRTLRWFKVFPKRKG